MFFKLQDVDLVFHMRLQVLDRTSMLPEVVG
jgi:hypothetical protein